MRIGIIGLGKMAASLGRKWASCGHKVFFGSRNPGKARRFAEELLMGTSGGTNDEAAGFGDVVLYTVRGVMPSEVLKTGDSLSGKIVVDINNRAIPDGFLFEQYEGLSLAERLAADIADARVVKAFNTVFYRVIDIPGATLGSQNVSTYIAGDDEDARKVVSQLAVDIGLTPVDCKGLRAARLLETTADFIRYLMFGEPALTGFATINLKVIEEQ